VVFAKLPPQILGWCNLKTSVITIDLEKSVRPYGLVYLHETLHYYRRDLAEDEVIYLSMEMWKKMSLRQRFILYKKIFNRRWRK